MSGFLHRLKTAIIDFGIGWKGSADPTTLGATAAQLPANLLNALSEELADRYAITEEIGSGGMALVFRAHDVKHDRDVALKILRPELTSQVGRERFLREIKLAARLTHPHILALHDSGHAAGLLYYVMPFVEGASLRDRLREEKHLSVDEALRIASAVAAALDYAHRQRVIHRDIKPGNIMILDGVAMVTDFGIGKALSVAGAVQLTQTGAPIGTPAYMSPEQMHGGVELDGRSDIYSLGCMLYEMLTGQQLFTGPSPQALLVRRISRPLAELDFPDAVPDHVQAAVRAALAEAPENRPATSAQLAEMLATPTQSPAAERAAPARPSNTPIAVPPSTNMTGDPANEYFSDGITEEIPNALVRGQRASDRQEWDTAYNQLLAADHEAALEPADLERLAMGAYLTGRYAEHAEILERAHHAHLRGGDVERAAYCAFWLGFGLASNGEPARGSGWLARAQRVLDEAASDCAVRGFLLVFSAAQFNERGDHEAAYARLREASKIGERFEDKDLTMLVRLAMGVTLNQMGDTVAGVALLDEVMVAVTADEVSPIMVGTAYCAVIEACHQIFDLRRAQEWTAAFSRWCSSHPDLVPYRGQCLVRRAEIMQRHGAWTDALQEAGRVREWLDEGISRPTIGAAYYLQGELHRLRGDFAESEEAYRRASECGCSPHPGMAQLRLGQGNTDAANAAIRHALDDSPEGCTRPSLLGAYIEITLAVGDVDAARTATAELAQIAAELGAPFLRATSAYATGAVLLADGDARGALTVLRRAWGSWHEQEAPYEAARLRVLVGRACSELGDHDTAEMEFEAARQVFQQLGASPDLARVEELSALPARGDAGNLTLREAEVLRLVATGMTNRAVAAELFISEKTVARHLSNIYTKLDLSTRAAATAYAYQHDIV